SIPEAKEQRRDAKTTDFFCIDDCIHNYRLYYCCNGYDGQHVCHPCPAHPGSCASRIPAVLFYAHEGKRTWYAGINDVWRTLGSTSRIGGTGSYHLVVSVSKDRELFPVFFNV